MAERVVGATPAVTVHSLRLGNNGPEIGAPASCGGHGCRAAGGLHGWDTRMASRIREGSPTDSQRENEDLDPATSRNRESCQQLRSSLETAAPADTLISTRETASRGPANLCLEAMR